MPQIVSQIIVITVIIAVFYFLLIRPQQKRQKKRMALIESVKAGDKVLTLGGIVGRVSQVKDDMILLETGKNVMLEMTKSAVAQKMEQPE